MYPSFYSFLFFFFWKELVNAKVGANIQEDTAGFWLCILTLEFFKMHFHFFIRFSNFNFL